MNSDFMAEKTIGPLTELSDSMYQMPMGALIQSFPNNKYFKLVCSPPEPDPGPSDQQVEPTGQTKNNAFDILMSNQAAAASKKFPARKTSR